MLTRFACLLGAALALSGCIYDPYYFGHHRHEWRHGYHRDWR